MSVLIGGCVGVDFIDVFGNFCCYVSFIDVCCGDYLMMVVCLCCFWFNVLFFVCLDWVFGWVLYVGVGELFFWYCDCLKGFGKVVVGWFGIGVDCYYWYGGFGFLLFVVIWFWYFFFGFDWCDYFCVW